MGRTGEAGHGPVRRKANKPVQEGMMGSAMKKILIVEDDTLLNTTLVYNLQEEKLSAASCISCAQARKRWRRSGMI